MGIQLNPYLHFNESTKEAMEYYQGVFGGTLTMSTFKEYGASSDPSEDEKIMHASLKVEDAFMFMASDTPNSMEYQPGKSMSMSLSGDDEMKLTRYWERLCDGGTVVMPLEKAAWGDTFGLVTDRFGVDWMVNISK
jgi:PhnB protein